MDAPLSYWHDSLAPGDDGRLPWVGHRSPPWEPEPLRWLGVHSVASLARVQDRVDTRRG